MCWRLVTESMLGELCKEVMEFEVLFGPFFHFQSHFILHITSLRMVPSYLNYLLGFIVAKFHNRWLESSVVTTICFSFIQAQ